MAIDLTKKEYNNLKKDIIKDIKKETRKKDYDSSNENSSRLMEIIKARRESGEGITSSLAGGVKERLKEKFDPRRIFNQTGLLTALFPKLRSYKANVPDQQSNGDVLNQPTQSADGLSATNPLFQSINTSTKIIAKNSMVLPLIQKDTNLMRQTLKKIIKAMQVRKKFVPVTRARPARVRNVPASQAKGLETEREEPEKEKGPIDILKDLVKSIAAMVALIGKSISDGLSGLTDKIIKGVISGIKGLFTATKIASSVLLSILRPLLGLIFSPAGFALLLAAGVFWSLYKLSNYLSKKVAEEVPNMNVMSPAEAAALMKNANKKNLITQASAAAGKKTPFTYEEAVDYLKNQILDGPKIAEEGLKLVDEEKRLSGILKSGDKSKIEAEGGEESIKKKISELKIRIANLGGEKKLREIIKETSSGIPIRVPSTSEMLSASDSDKSDQLVGKTTQGVRRENQISRRDSRVVSENIDRDDNDIGKTIRANAAVSNTLKMEQGGYGEQSATSPLKDPFKSPNIISSSSGDINVGLTSPSVTTQDGPGNSMPISVAPPPKPVPTQFTSNELQLSEELNRMNEYLAEEGIPYQDVDSDAFATYMNVLRINSPLNDGHPDIVKALKIKMHHINSMIAY